MTRWRRTAGPVVRAWFVVAMVSCFFVTPVSLTPASASSAVSPVSLGKFRGIVPRRGSQARRPRAVSPLAYHGGRVQHSSHVFAIYWVPPGYSLPNGYQTTVNRYFTDVAHDSFRPSNVYASDTQYFDVQAGKKQFISYSTSFQGAIVDTAALPADGCANYLLDDGSTSKNCITDAQIEGEISSVVTAHHLPSGLATEYFLFTPQGLASCFDATALATGGCYDPAGFDGFCAYHSSTSGSASAILYANQSFADLPGCSSGESPNGNPADSVINVVSHEHNETITDPLGTAWFDGSGMENGDKCAFNFGPALGGTGSALYNQVINGHRYWLQLEWSNRTKGCVARNTFPQPTASFTFSPASPSVGTTVKFTSSAHDSDDTVFTYRWTFPDGSVSTLPNPARSFNSVGKKPVTLIVFDPHGDQVRVTRTVSVS